MFGKIKTAKLKPAMITTVGAQISDLEYETGLHTTTPSSFALQKYIKHAVDAKCNYMVLETTSHALDQNRILGVDFKIGVLTNITHEHMDYHKTYENYVKAKAKLFQKAEISILNKDDESFNPIKSMLEGKKIFTYSTKTSADFTPAAVKQKLPSEFDFNHHNFLAAIAVAKILNIPHESIQLALTTFNFPKGRQEIVYERGFKVIVDFAHTPNSFAQILPSLKQSSRGRLIHVFGAAGARDRSKRPLMGQISSKSADIIILTAEDPRSEKIDDINAQIKIGINKKFNSADFKLYTDGNEKNLCFEIPDRSEAIEFAISIAKDGDTIITTGKGHEKSMNMGSGEIPWSEHKAVENALRKRFAD